ncbi:Aste57867_21219 [Aphanomyces stellatus]|uniref:Aste57867_21219 protein n=1 Tax=Aphanomyces stellatus TaxID=120398 RepID=A0A485LGY0_9STRA|nr:hypothetical protein As57867_021151 [Aphanomyces stellatus]VFT97891.1 Aste57867_21219 [Aphanomyces stellatus]
MMDRNDVNALVMTYLVGMGHVKAAEVFAKETADEGVHEDGEVRQKMEKLREKARVKDLLRQGHVDEAISCLSSLAPTLIEENIPLAFELWKQKFIELIKRGLMQEAWEEVTSGLRGIIDRSDTGLSKELHSDMERALCLLAFESPSESPYASLLDPSLRIALSNRVYDALNEIDPILPRLAKEFPME